MRPKDIILANNSFAVYIYRYKTLERSTFVSPLTLEVGEKNDFFAQDTFITQHKHNKRISFKANIFLFTCNA